MNHLVRTEAKRIYQKIRNTLSSEGAEYTNENLITQQSTSRYPETKIIKHSS